MENGPRNPQWIRGPSPLSKTRKEKRLRDQEASAPVHAMKNPMEWMTWQRQGARAMWRV